MKRGRRVSPTSLCEGSALPSHASVSQKPPLPLHPHLTLQVVFFWDLEARERNGVSRELEKCLASGWFSGSLKRIENEFKKNICAAWSVPVYLIEEKLWFHSHSGHILVKVHWGWVAASLYMTRQSSVNTWIDRNWKFSLNTFKVKLSQTTTVVSSYLTNSLFMKWRPCAHNHTPNVSLTLAGVREGSENQQHTHLWPEM